MLPKVVHPGIDKPHAWSLVCLHALPTPQPLPYDNISMHQIMTGLAVMPNIAPQNIQNRKASPHATPACVLSLGTDISCCARVIVQYPSYKSNLLAWSSIKGLLSPDSAMLAEHFTAGHTAESIFNHIEKSLQKLPWNSEPTGQQKDPFPLLLVCSPLTSIKAADVWILFNTIKDMSGLWLPFQHAATVCILVNEKCQRGFFSAGPGGKLKETFTSQGNGRFPDWGQHIPWSCPAYIICSKEAYPSRNIVRAFTHPGWGASNLCYALEEESLSFINCSMHREAQKRPWAH